MKHHFYSYIVLFRWLIRETDLKGYIFQKFLHAWTFSCINKKCFSIKETDTFGHIVVWTMYASHIDHFTPPPPPTYSFWANRSMLISLFRVTSWFDTVCNIVTRWVNIRKNSCMHMHYNYPTTIFRSFFAQMYKFLVEKYILTIFAYELFNVKMKNCK